MIHTTTDFYNKVATETRQRYFADVIHAKDNNTNYYKHLKAIEDFSNGVLTYKVFIGRLAKNCQTNNATIHNLVEKHIISFGSYQYKPRKLYSENKVIKN